MAHEEVYAIEVAVGQSRIEHEVGCESIFCRPIGEKTQVRVHVVSCIVESADTAWYVMTFTDGGSVSINSRFVSHVFWRPT